MTRIGETSVAILFFKEIRCEVCDQIPYYGAPTLTTRRVIHKKTPEPCHGGLIHRVIDFLAATSSSTISIFRRGGLIHRVRHAADFFAADTVDR